MASFGLWPQVCRLLVSTVSISSLPTHCSTSCQLIRTVFHLKSSLWGHRRPPLPCPPAVSIPHRWFPSKPFPPDSLDFLLLLWLLPSLPLRWHRLLFSATKCCTAQFWAPFLSCYIISFKVISSTPWFRLLSTSQRLPNISLQPMSLHISLGQCFCDLCVVRPGY